MSFAQIIEQAYSDKDYLKKHKTEVSEAVNSVIDSLDRGELRLCTPRAEGGWQLHEWLKKAILLYFSLNEVSLLKAGDFSFVDKIPVKSWRGDEGVRVVPQAIVRRGAYVASGAILMPSFVNIGAYVGSGTMVDTWATVGSCAQVGANVHLSGGVGIGGVLEPLQARPVIIEDNVFVGSRSIIVEGAWVRRGAVLGAGAVITGSTRIVDVTGKEPKLCKGEIPENAVVIPGTMPKEFPAGAYQIPCALIIGKRTESTDLKTSLNKALRDFSVSV